MRNGKNVIAVGLLALGLTLTGCGDVTKASHTTAGTSSDLTTNDATSSQGTSSISSAEIVSSDSSKESSSVAPNPLTLAEAIAAGKAASAKVKSGTVTKNADTDNVETYKYEFGTDKYGTFIRLDNKDQWTDTTDYYGRNKAGEPIGIEIDHLNDDAVSATLDEPTEDMIMGYNFFPVNDSYENYYYGPEDLITKLYALGTSTTDAKVQDFKGDYKDSKYTFSFGFLLSEFTFFVDSFEFTLGTDNIFDTMTFKIENYSNSNFIIDDETGDAVLNEEAVPDGKDIYSIAQVYGTRDLANPYDIENYYFTSFDLENDSEKIVADKSTLSINIGYEGAVNLGIANPLPATASTNFDSLKTKVYNSENEEVEGEISATYNNFNKKLNISANTAGTYTLKILTKNVTKTLTIVAKNPDPESILVMTYEDTGNISTDTGKEAYDSTIVYTEYTSYVGLPVNFSASVSPYDANQEVTFTGTDPESKAVTFTGSTINTGIIDVATSAFTPEAIGDYTIIATSNVSADVKTTFTLHVEATPTAKTFLNKDYVDMNKKYKMAFKASEVTDNTGTVEMTINATKEVSTYTYAYTPDTRAITLTNTSGTDQAPKITISPVFKLTLGLGIDSYVLFERTPAVLASGSWVYSDTTTGYEYNFTFSLDGGLNISRNNYSAYEYLYGECSFKLAYDTTADKYYVTFAKTGNTGTDLDNIIDFTDKTSYFASDFSAFNFKEKGASDYKIFSFSAE